MLGKSKEVERELIFCQAKVESLQEQLRVALADREELRKQITNLQEALIAVKAPEAYRDQVYEREEAKRPKVTPEELERNRIHQTVVTEYLNGMERPIFTSGDDLEDMINTAIIRTNKPPSSVHGNNES